LEAIKRYEVLGSGGKMISEGTKAEGADMQLS
jgi:hypothetical protein